MLIKLLILTILVTLSIASRDVVKIEIRSELDLVSLIRLARNSNGSFEIWDEESNLMNVIFADLDNTNSLVVNELIKNSRTHQIIGDYNQLIQRQKSSAIDGRFLFTDGSNSVGFNYEGYQRLSTIESELRRYSTEYPSFVRFVSIGRTFEGRRLNLVTIGDQQKPPIFIECGIHAREWISPSACMWIIRDLVTNSTLLDRLVTSTTTRVVTNGFFFQLLIPCPTGDQSGWLRIHMAW